MPAAPLSRRDSPTAPVLCLNIIPRQRFLHHMTCRGPYRGGTIQWYTAWHEAMEGRNRQDMKGKRQRKVEEIMIALFPGASSVGIYHYHCESVFVIKNRGQIAAIATEASASQNSPTLYLAEQLRQAIK
jgi:hypothetical protein